MRTPSHYGMIAAVASSLVIAGCYTQLGSTQEDQPPEEVTYLESDSAGEDVVSADAYDDARYRFYVGVGYPYWSPAFSFGFWDPYPFDPWLWGPPAYWYPYGAYYGSGWYYPPAAYYPPGYWYGGPAPVYPPGYGGYTNRTFGTTRGYGAMGTGGGAYRGATATSVARPGLNAGVRQASMRLVPTTARPAVQGRTTTSPSAVDRPASTSPSVRRGKSGTRSSTPAVRPAPEQRKSQGSGSRQSVTPATPPDRKPEGSSAKPRSSDSGGSRSYSSPRSSSPPPSSSPSSHPSGSSARGGSSGGGSGSPRSGGRR